MNGTDKEAIFHEYGNDEDEVYYEYNIGDIHPLYINERKRFKDLFEIIIMTYIEWWLVTFFIVKERDLIYF